MTAPRLILRLCILTFSLSLNEVLALIGGVGGWHRQAQDLIIENFETSPKALRTLSIFCPKLNPN
jgi:hypothetical protein